MAQGGGESSDSASVYFLTAIILLFALMLSMPLYIDELLSVWRYVRIGQLWILAWIPDWMPFFGKLPIDDAHACLVNVRTCLDGGDLTTNVANTIDRATLAYFSWIPGLFFIIVGVRHLMKNESVNSRHNMETLLKQNAPLYRNSAPFANAHPEHADLHWDRAHRETAEFGFSLSPERFAQQCPPPGLAKAARKNSAYKQPIWDGNLGFDLDLAERAFAQQLGARFTGIEQMDATAKSVYAQLTAGLTFSQATISPILSNALSKQPEIRLDCDRRLIDQLRAKGHLKDPDEESQPTKSSKEEPVTLRARIKSLLAEQEMEPFFRECLAERIMHRHGFVITGLMGLLEEARQGGVVAGCELLWVKRKNRTYWYALNSVGRKVAFVEGAGPYAHWLIERHLGRPLSHPEVSEAVTGLEISLKMDVRRQLAEETST